MPGCPPSDSSGKNGPRSREFLSLAGVGASAGSRPTVFLIGAGTSDYIGHSLTYLLRRCWHCEVIAVPSTDLLTHMDDLMIPEGSTFGFPFRAQETVRKELRYWKPPGYSSPRDLVQCEGPNDPRER
jgi:hypothetical protein